MIDLLFDIPDKLASLADAIFTLLFSTISIFGIDISLWEILGGVAITFLVIRSIIRS